MINQDQIIINHNHLRKSAFYYHIVMIILDSFRQPAGECPHSTRHHACLYILDVHNWNNTSYFLRIKVISFLYAGFFMETISKLIHKESIMRTYTFVVSNVNWLELFSVYFVGYLNSSPIPA